MPSLIKQQILRPLSIFAKNLDPDKIKLSALKGEVNMTNLELNEEVLMELLDLPRWLRINSAVCANISIKIPWTNLKSRSINMVVDNVSVNVEVLDRLRNKYEGNSVPSYRASTGRYGMVDRAIDSISIRIHELNADLISKVFRASVNLSHINLSSKKPNWESGPLSSCFIPCPQRNAILIFKEISWESTRIEADGLDDRMTPVKLITNRAKLRVVLKKRLSDSVLICGKMSLSSESLLWVLTVSQLEAAIVFLKYIKRSMHLAADFEKHSMTERIKLISSLLTVVNTPDQISHITGRPIDPRLVQVFDAHDVKENSVHLHIHHVETHFCEDNLRKASMSTQLIDGGSVRMTLKNVYFDHYPAHPKSSPRTDWQDYSDIHYPRSQWLQSLKPHSDPDAAVSRVLGFPPASEIYESVVVFRLQDITVTCVALEGQREEVRWPLPPTISRRDRGGGGAYHKRRTVLAALDAEQRSLVSNTLLASDLEMHKLPLKTNLLAVDMTKVFVLDDCEGDLPIVMFAQVNPLHVKFDVDTLIWLNAFLLNLTANLQTLFDDMGGVSEQPSALSLFLRAEALMPRVIFPMHPPPPDKENNSGTPEYPWTGPTALVMQIDQAVVQTLPRPLTPTMAQALSRSLDNLEKQSRPPEKTSWDREHMPIDVPQFRRFASIEPLSPASQSEPRGVLACVQCPSIWAEFLTICEAATLNAAMPSFKTYRQAFFDPAPFTCWCLLPSFPPFYRPASATRQPVVWSPDLGRHLPSPPALPAPLSVLIDFNTVDDPLSIHPAAFRTSAKIPKPLHFTIGHSGAVFTFRSVERLRLPDAVDHIVFLYGLAFRLARLKASVGLDGMEIRMRMEEERKVKRYHEWLLTAKCLLTHGVEVEVDSTVDSRFIDPPVNYEKVESSSESSLKTDSERVQETAVESKNASSISEAQQQPVVYGYVPPPAPDQMSKLSTPESSFGLIYGGVSSFSLDSDASTLDGSAVVVNVDSFEMLIPDEDALNDVFDEIPADEVGVDVVNSEEVEAPPDETGSVTVVDEDQALHFPPWSVQRLLLDLKDLTFDADITTVEARLWLGVGSISFINPDEFEEPPPDDSPQTASSACDSDVGGGARPPVFVVSLRLGGDALPGQPSALVAQHEGWVAVRVAQVREGATLYPLPAAWLVVEALLGHATARGGSRACARLVASGPGVGSLPLRPSPQLLDLVFCLERGSLVLDLTARPRQWGRRPRKEDKLVRKKPGKAPVQKIKLVQGFSASLNSEGVLEVFGALPIRLSDRSHSRPSSLVTTAVSTGTTAVSSRPMAGSQSPPMPPPPRKPSLRRSTLANGGGHRPTFRENTPPPPPPRGEQGAASVSLAEDNARLRLMVERLKAQVLSLTTDLTRFKTRYPNLI